MRHISIGSRLPYFISRRLFGARREFGPVPREDDPCWQEWTRTACLAFYEATQKRSVGKVVNDAGYRILQRVALEGRKVLEIGPGHISHMPFWRGRPREFTIADINEAMLDESTRKLHAQGVSVTPVLLSRKDLPRLPFGDGAFDIVLSFYSLEHLYPLASYLAEILRCLGRGGLLVGAIPTEGGLVWGLGRYVTSRRWLLRNTAINPDKIICWEHPTFAEEILATIQSKMRTIKLGFYPFLLPVLDVNLLVTFVFEKP